MHFADDWSNDMKHLKTIIVSSLMWTCLSGCAGNVKTAPPLTADQSAAKSRMEGQMQQAAKTAQTYHAMDNATLLNHLEEQSKAMREPFNSLAYRELKTRTDVDSNALKAQVEQNRNAAGLLPLLLLRQLDNKTYLGISVETRAEVLTDALQASKTFNTWGLPGAYLEDASNAMIETGKAADPALKRMLGETRVAPIFGSKEYMLAQQYKYRLCDYALFFLKRIDGYAEFKLPTTSEERDALIKQTAAAK
jgi:hypothetical protein